MDLQDNINNMLSTEIKSHGININDHIYLNTLNDRQVIAATREEGNYLTIAGPGSGKTHTLVYRVLYLLDKGHDPSSIVLTTFTRKAADEIKYRIKSFLGEEIELGFVGTIHSLANHINTTQGKLSPLSSFRILDTEDDIQVHKIVKNPKDFVTKGMTVKSLQKLCSFADNNMISISECVDQIGTLKQQGDKEGIVKHYQNCVEYKLNNKLFNYDDLIRYMIKFLENSPIDYKYKFLMVDEYQDTNPLQFEFIKTLNIQNIMAIGDDFQGIYRFRGADHRIILNFYNDFSNPQLIVLTKNYRSTSNIVDIINKTVENSKLGYKKQLDAVSNQEGKFELKSGVSNNEISLVKTFIDSAVENTKLNKTTALIYRYNKDRNSVERELIKQKLDYVIYGGIRFLERKHVKDTLAFLLVKFNNRDVISFIRILTLLEGVGPKKAEQLMKSNIDIIDKTNLKTHTALKSYKKIIYSDDDFKVTYQKIIKLYISIVDVDNNLYYTKNEILDDLKSINELLMCYESFTVFLNDLVLNPVRDKHKGKKKDVVLTTIHSAKGLEFDDVHYIHSSKFTHSYDIEDLEEDRRMFYVGISRAKTSLNIYDFSSYQERSFEQLLLDFENTYEVTEKKSKSKTDEEVQSAITDILNRLKGKI